MLQCRLQRRQEGLKDVVFAVPALTWALEAAGCRYSLGLTAAVAAMLPLDLQGSTEKGE